MLFISVLGTSVAYISTRLNRIFDSINLFNCVVLLLLYYVVISVNAESIVVLEGVR